MAYVVGIYLAVATLIAAAVHEKDGWEHGFKLGLLWPIMILGWALPVVVIFILAALFAEWTGDLTRSIF